MMQLNRMILSVAILSAMTAVEVIGQRFQDIDLGAPLVYLVGRWEAFFFFFS